MLLRRILVSTLLLTVMFIMACGSKEETSSVHPLPPPDTPSVGEQPQILSAEELARAEAEKVLNSSAELTIAYPFANEALFEGRFGEQIRKKFSNYKINFLETATNKDNQLADVLATNPTIDILFASYGASYTNLINHNLQTDISDLIKKYNYDINQFQPAPIDVARQLANGQIYGLPWLNGGFVFLYNKDIFDKFGADYPADGMTWDEVYDLAKSLTRKDGDTNYYGLTMAHDHLVGRNQLSVPMIDPQSHQALFTEDRFKNLLQNLLRFYEIPGNEQLVSLSANNLFQKDQVVAMMIHTDGHIQITAGVVDNWDLATFPVFKENPEVGFAPFPEFVYMTSLSKNRDAAFQVLTYVVSEEQQAWRASTLGFVPSLKNVEKIMDNFGSSIPGIDTKNTQAIVPKQYANFQVSRFYSIGLGEINTIVRDYVGGKDLNTALREAAERADVKIAEELEKLK